MLTKFVVYLIVLLIAVTPLVACGDSSSDVGDPNNPSGPIVIGGWPAGDEAFMAIEDLFLAKFPDVEIEYQFMTGDDYRPAFLTALAAGSGAPDVAMVEGGWIGEVRDSLALEDLREQPFDANRLANDFVRFRWELGQSLDGRQTGIPWDIGPATMFYRRDIFEEVGLPYEPDEVEEFMSTWDGFVQAAELVHIPGQRWLLPDASQLFFWLFMNRDFYNEKLEFQLDRPGVMEAYDAAYKIRTNGWDMQVGMWTDEAYAGFNGGGLAIVVAGSWYGGFLKSWVSPDNPGLWGVTRLPAGIKDSNWGGSFVTIPTQSTNKAAAWAYVEFSMADPVAQNVMFEAVDYFPALITSWDDASIYNAPDPWFADQQTRALWVDISKAIKPYHTTMLDVGMDDLILDSVSVAMNQGMSAQEAMDHIMDYVTSMKAEEREANIDLLRDHGLWND